MWIITGIITVNNTLKIYTNIVIQLRILHTSSEQYIKDTHEYCNTTTDPYRDVLICCERPSWYFPRFKEAKFGNIVINLKFKIYSCKKSIYICVLSVIDLFFSLFPHFYCCYELTIILYWSHFCYFKTFLISSAAMSSCISLFVTFLLEIGFKLSYDNLWP